MGDTAMVLGYLDHTEHAVWQDNLVGFGVKSQLFQALYEKGRYQLIEEKIDSEHSSEQTLSLEDNPQNSWMLSPQRIALGALANTLSAQNVDHLFWVEVTDFGKPARGFSIGVYYSRSVKTMIKVKICRYSADAQIRCGVGTGTSTRRANAFVYHIRQDKKARGLFQNSSIGKSTNKAVIHALDDLLEQHGA